MKPEYDLIIVGGGCVGLFSALDAASRGLKILVLEKGAVGSGTSSNSTKLMHGGVRYLKQLKIGFVLEGLKERAYFLSNASCYVYPIEMIAPTRTFFEKWFTYLGLKLYQLLSFNHSIGKTRFLSKEEVIEKAPNVKRNGLNGGILFFDAQFYDEELILALKETLIRMGVTIKEQTKVTHINDGIATTENGAHFIAKGIILALGSDSDAFLEHLSFPPILAPRRGTHIFFDRSFHPSKAALFDYKAIDGRVFFVLPYKDYTLCGTTEVPSNSLEATDQEINFILKESAKLLEKAPSRKDILKITTGLRPLLRKAKGGRDFEILRLCSKLILCAGGKWISARKNGESTIDIAIRTFSLRAGPSKTKQLIIQQNKDFMKPRAIILLGPPGTGKGTQAEIISATLKAKHLSTGDLLRDEISKKTALGQKIQSIVESGQFIDDDTMFQLLKPHLEGLILLDGFPRTIEQAKMLQSTVTILTVLNLFVPASLIVERLTQRRSCPKCKMVYNLSAKKPKNEGYCDQCSELLVQRKDDTADVIQKRLSIYEESTKPLIAYYEKLGLLKKIDATQSIEKVAQEIDKECHAFR